MGFARNNKLPRTYKYEQNKQCWPSFIDLFMKDWNILTIHDLRIAFIIVGGAYLKPSPPHVNYSRGIQCFWC